LFRVCFCGLGSGLAVYCLFLICLSLLIWLFNSVVVFLMLFDFICGFCLPVYLVFVFGMFGVFFFVLLLRLCSPLGWLFVFVVLCCLFVVGYLCCLFVCYVVACLF